MRKVNYLPTRYDRMDEYHQLEDSVTKEDFLLFMRPIIGGCKNFRHFNPTKHHIDKACNRRDESLYHIVGGFFGKIGYYRQPFYNNWLPEDLRHCMIKDKNLTERRFNWVLMELSKLPEEKPVKKSFTREEVIDLLHDLKHDIDNARESQEHLFLDEWITKNV